jgi:hypothetical protein
MGVCSTRELLCISLYIYRYITSNVGVQQCCNFRLLSCRWWRDIYDTVNLTYIRDRVVESYLCTCGMVPEEAHWRGRLIFAKTYGSYIKKAVCWFLEPKYGSFGAKVWIFWNLEKSTYRLFDVWILHQKWRGSFGATWEVSHVLHQKGGMLIFLGSYSNLVILMETIPF